MNKRKKCIRCGKTRLLKFFTYYDKKNGKRRNTCKDCQNIVNATMPNAILTRRNTILRREFGITHKEYIQILKLQNGVCAICKTKPIVGKNLCIDHCHETGKIRGLLCFNCNTGLGHFKDNMNLLTSAQNYITTPTWQA
jgi:hypothetical protein